MKKPYFMAVWIMMLLGALVLPFTVSCFSRTVIVKPYHPHKKAKVKKKNHGKHKGHRKIFFFNNNS